MEEQYMLLIIILRDIHYKIWLVLYECSGPTWILV